MHAMTILFVLRASFDKVKAKCQTLYPRYIYPPHHRFFHLKPFSMVWKSKLEQYDRTFGEKLWLKSPKTEGLHFVNSYAFDSFIKVVPNRGDLQQLGWSATTGVICSEIFLVKISLYQATEHEIMCITVENIIMMCPHNLLFCPLLKCRDTMLWWGKANTVIYGVLDWPCWWGF